MKYYAVIDTNVLVSAMLRWDSIPGNVMAFVFSETIIPLLNEHIVKEYREVLSRPKFHLTEDIIRDIVDEISRLGIYIDSEELDMILPDPKDIVFYEVVMEKRKSEEAYLVTGNIKHFPAKPYVVTPRQMMDIIIRSMEE
ncbi:MAG: putative toxin-antitoxin system toxin component, PIN family [Lachnospiraceae bacterium]|nr:putative toxin-antitoxin system toxin component, PIN family [Lachnospiraceae bacterium]